MARILNDSDAAGSRYHQTHVEPLLLDEMEQKWGNLAKQKLNVPEELFSRCKKLGLQQELTEKAYSTYGKVLLKWPRFVDSGNDILKDWVQKYLNGIPITDDVSGYKRPDLDGIAGGIVQVYVSHGLKKDLEEYVDGTHFSLMDLTYTIRKVNKNDPCRYHAKVVAKLVDIPILSDVKVPATAVLKYYTTATTTKFNWVWYVVAYSDPSEKVPSFKLARVIETRWRKQALRFKNAKEVTSCNPEDFVRSVEKETKKKFLELFLIGGQLVRPPHVVYKDRKRRGKSRRLISLPVPGCQEPLGHHPIQPSETSHAVGYVEADEGMSLGELAIVVLVATVLLGLLLITLRFLFPKGFRGTHDDKG